MKLKYKKQQFQQDAVNAVCDVFEGQSQEAYRSILGKETSGLAKFQKDTNIYAWSNGEISLSDGALLENIKKIQDRNGIPQSSSLEGNGKNITVEMETGTGKTYTYLNTIYELNKRYGWTKFVVVVPSIAIRQTVDQAIQSMQSHFSTLYGKNLRHFVFDSSKPQKIRDFATNSGINIMIINNHAFNKKEKNNLYGYDERGPKLIDYIRSTNPIMIIDEPQKVEGEKTKLALDNYFGPLFNLRYSATHRNVYNMVYRLDALDAFNKDLVKKISVKGVNVKGTTGTNSYIYFQGFDISKKSPEARLEIEVAQSNGPPKRKTVKVSDGDDLYHESGKLNQYEGFKITELNANSGFIRFTNGHHIKTGELSGEINEEHLRRIQIRETIRAHLRKEQDLYKKGIKVISLFFIDQVQNYRDYNESNEPLKGKYAEIFEEEYEKLIDEFKDDPEYSKYLESIDSEKTHEGYFSIDKKGKLQNPKEKGKGSNKISDDVSAYDLIMNRKEQLLSLKEKTRFIFSHSALREGWDNPNVFQLCILRNTDPKEVKTRQEVGRGLRLCVNQKGERIDNDYEGLDFSSINVLTIVANNSYEEFAKRLQSEYYENISDRPSSLTIETLQKKKVNGERISKDFAVKIYNNFVRKGYVGDKGEIKEKYYEDLEKGSLELEEGVKIYENEIKNIVREIFEGIPIQNENDYSSVPNRLNDNFKDPEFRKLWQYINKATTYTVDFSSSNLVEDSVKEIDEKLDVSRVVAVTETGELKDDIKDREQFGQKEAFSKRESKEESLENVVSDTTKYDLIGDIETETRLTRNTIIEILSKIKKEKFDQFTQNPEDFKKKISSIINEKKAVIINENISYHPTNKEIPIEIFEKGISRHGKAKKMDNRYVYDYVVTDSETERKFAEDVDISDNVRVFSKIPKGEYNINTPVGNFSPDWIVVFHEDKVTYAYFVTDTKGSSSEKDLRETEKIKIKCAKKHFEAISSGNVKFDAVSSFDELKEKANSPAT